MNRDSNLFARKDTLSAGVGIRCRVVGNRRIFSSSGSRGQFFSHPWQCSLSGASATFETGTVNAIEPTIKNKDGVIAPMSGAEPKKKGELKEQAVMPIDLQNFDTRGRSWICVETTYGKKWELLSCALVQVSAITTKDGKPPEDPKENSLALARYPSLPGRKSRYPINLMRKDEVGGITVFEIAYFNLQTIAAPVGGLATSEKARIFFFPT